MPEPPLRVRAARPEDRAAVLAFCAQTWSWGDYIGWVWDRWLADPRGLFAVGEVADRIVAVYKLTFLAPGEAFLEGLRVDPAYRGHGYGRQMQSFLLAAAARQGARTARLITAAANTAVHRMAAQDGLARRCVLHPWAAPALAADTDLPVRLRPLPDGAPAAAAWAALPQGFLWAVSAGLVTHHWHVQDWTPALWTAWRAAGALLQAHDRAGAPAGLLAVAVDPANPEDFWLAWIAAPASDPPALTALLQAAQRLAGERGFARIQFMPPPIPALAAALTAAGWSGGEADDALLVFEKVL